LFTEFPKFIRNLCHLKVIRRKGQFYLRIDLLVCRIKYSISIVADKGLKKPLFTSARLKKGEVLYLETHSCRYAHHMFLLSDINDIRRWI